MSGGCDVSNFESVLGNAVKLTPPKELTKSKSDPQGPQWKVNYHLKDDEVFESVLNKLVDIFSPICDKYIFGEEYGKSGKTRHIEGGFILNTDRMRRSTILNKFKFSDCQKSTGTVSAREYKWNQILKYCSKESNNIKSNCKVPRALKLIPIDILRKEQREIVEQFREPCPPIWEERGLIYWFWEPDGGWGKSVVSLWMIDHLNAFVGCGANKDILFGFKQQVDEGNTPDILVFDIPRCNSNHVSYQAIESIKNGYLYSPKYEGGMCRFNPPHVICFGNEPPNLQNMSEDRWRVINLTGKGEKCEISDNEDDSPLHIGEL